MAMDLRDAGGSKLSFVIVCVACAVCQLAIAPNLGFFGGCANFALVLALCVAMSEGGPTAVLTGFCAGLFYDLSSTGPVGLMALELTMLGYLLGTNSRNYFAEDAANLGRTFLVGSGTVLLVYQLVMLVLEGGSLVDALVFRFLPSLALTALAFAPFAFWYARQVSAGSSLGLGAKGKGKGKGKARHGRFDTPGL